MKAKEYEPLRRYQVILRGIYTDIVVAGEKLFLTSDQAYELRDEFSKNFTWNFRARYAVRYV